MGGRKREGQTSCFPFLCFLPRERGISSPVAPRLAGPSPVRVVVPHADVHQGIADEAVAVGRVVCQALA